MAFAEWRAGFVHQIIVLIGVGTVEFEQKFRSAVKIGIQHNDVGPARIVYADITQIHALVAAREVDAGA